MRIWRRFLSVVFWAGLPASGLAQGLVTFTYSSRVPVVIVAALSAAWSGWAQGTTTVTFEWPSPTPPGGYSPITQYDEGGVHFWNPIFSMDTLALVGGGISSLPDNGTPYLVVPSTAQLSFNVPGSPFPRIFGLMSLDLAEYYTSLVGPRTLTVVGYGGMGYSVTNTITTDGINDGTGPLQDFQTFTFGPEWAHIYRVDILNGAFSIDNVVLTGIPEPSSAALVALGAAVMCWLRRNKPQ